MQSTPTYFNQMGIVRLQMRFLSAALSSPVNVSALFSEWTEESSSLSSPFFLQDFFLRSSFNDRLLEVSATAKSIKSALPSLCLVGSSSLGLETRELFFCPFSLFLERLWNCSHSGSGTVGGGGSHSECCWASDDDETSGDFDSGGVGAGGGSDGVGVVFVDVIAVCVGWWSIRIGTGKCSCQSAAFSQYSDN